MKCYLENLGALSSDNVIAMKQAVLHFSTNEDLINSCLTEQSDIGMMLLVYNRITGNINKKLIADSLDACEYAYFLARCIMMATLVDNRKSDT